ncbi:NADH-ubiquinone oxidoreductase 12 kDa subunit [Verticillium dahliae VDG1]|nr:NADH-ubiquinone oxidoreductase 12 kDa subunit [Verticillium dahliae VDG1]
MAAPFSAAAAHADYKSPSFTQKVVDVMRKHFPEELAERSWDNVGLLLGNLETGGSETKNASPVVLVTNDLTYAVAKEAIAKKASVIVAYHPIIFSGLKSITSKDAQQATLILLASHGIAAVQDGILLFTLFHSNSERGFLRERLVPLLQGELTALEAGAKVYMSEVDRDPFEIITV